MSELDLRPTQAADTGRWKARTLALILLVLPAAPAISGDHAAGTALCAEREVLLQTLIEAHGSAPNAASAILVASSVAIAEARAACAEGRAAAALAIYDDLIARLRFPDERETTSVTGRAAR
jgi:hypothetical protein